MRKKSIVKGLAGAAALAGASQAYATVIVRPVPANIAGVNPATNTSTATVTRNIDVDGNGTTDISIRYRSFNVNGGANQIQQSFVFSNTGLTACAGPYGTQNQYYAYDLASGDHVDPSYYQFAQNHDLPNAFLTHVATNIDGNDYGFWYLGERAFIGFSFMAPSGLKFGYLELQTNAWTGAGTIGVQFFSLAYEDSGAPILAGAVPEPSTLAALAFGVVGLGAAALRRKKS